MVCTAACKQGASGLVDMHACSMQRAQSAAGGHQNLLALCEPVTAWAWMCGSRCAMDTRAPATGCAFCPASQHTLPQRSPHRIASDSSAQSACALPPSSACMHTCAPHHCCRGFIAAPPSNNTAPATVMLANPPPPPNAVCVLHPASSTAQHRRPWPGLPASVRICRPAIACAARARAGQAPCRCRCRCSSSIARFLPAPAAQIAFAAVAGWRGAVQLELRPVRLVGAWPRRRAGCVHAWAHVCGHGIASCLRLQRLKPRVLDVQHVEGRGRRGHVHA